MFVTENDRKNERQILSVVAKFFPHFIGFEFHQNDPDSIYDYEGKKDGNRILCDIKVRTIMPDSFGGYFISKEKVDGVGQDPVYIVYYFTPAKIVRIYELHASTIKKTIAKFIHRRSGTAHEDKCYEISSHPFIYEMSCELTPS